MSIGIVHLSDIHIRTRGNPVCSRVSQIQNAIRGVASDVSDLLLVVTGDIAFSGKDEEYALAMEFLTAVEDGLRKLPCVNFLGSVVIPGNHDCDFENQGSVRNLLVDSVPSITNGFAAPPEDFVHQVLSVQERFFDFEASLCRDGSPNNRLSWTRQFSTSEGKIAVRCFNTAWLSQKEEIRKLIFPVALASETVPDAELVVTLFHHPYNWFEPDNGRALRKIVETTSDVVLTGHEHDSDAYAKVGGNATTNYVEGAALQAAGITTGFNYLKIDFNARIYQVHQFRWADDMFSASAVNSAVFARNQRLLEHRFVNSSSFRKLLGDPGTPFSHPVRTELHLRDLFVYPDLRVIRLTATPDRTEKVVSGPNVLNYVSEKKQVIIAGPPTSGKTSLAKILYEDFQEVKSLVPILLAGPDFRGVESSQIMSVVRKAFQEQYSPGLLERFNQLDPNLKAVIIDDWHRLKFNPKGRDLIAETLEKMFGTIVLISDDASILRQVCELQTSKVLAKFEHCEIKEFGCQLRGELITRWHCLGRELEADEMELTHSIATSENLLNTLIGKGVLPSFPVYVFSALQVSDRGAGQNASYGSYGHIYESLLTARMARVSRRNLGQKYTYLSILAYRMFQTGKATLDPGDLREIHNEYWKNYMSSIDQDVFLDELVKSQLLSWSGENITFQYKYAYYFCVAKYFQEGMANIEDAAVLSARLREMADTAYDDENAHVLIFYYLYMTKDRPLIEHILHNASSLFADKGPTDLKKDVEFVNALYSQRPTLVAPSEETRRNREEFRHQRDVALEQEGSTSLNRNPDSLHIDLAFESLLIMGQVLRNFPGNLRADLKLRLTYESYQLGLRTLRTFLKDIEASLGGLREDLVRHLRENESFARRNILEVRSIADKLMVSLSELAIFAVIKKISFSVGLEDLRDVYKAARNRAGEDHIPTRLIDLSIMLDHFGRLPVEDVRDLELRLRGNMIVHTVLRILIAEHLALLPINYKVRQSMVQLFNFQPRALLLPDKKIKQLVSGH